MKVSSIVDNNNDMSFKLDGVDVCVANALRRTLLSDIPNVVIRTLPVDKNDAHFTINTTRFNNEILKQRLSCIPIHITDLSVPIAQMQLEVDVENKSTEFMYITTEDIKIKNTTTEEYLNVDDVREIFPANPQTGYFIDIVRLRPKLSPDTPGERLAFTAKMSIGTADDSSMYNVVSTCSYGNTQDMEEVALQSKIREQELRDAGTNKDNIAFEMEDWRLLDAQRIYLKNSFDFVVKTVGVFTCPELLRMGCDRMEVRIDNLIKLFTTNDDKKVKITSTTTTVTNGYDVSLYDEDYTIGMLLQHILYTKYYEGPATTMNFCGFKKYHPHDSFIVLRVGYKEQTPIAKVTDDFLSALNEASTIFKDMSKMF